ncbi:hypothetical protein QFZ70_001256 [Arthrobacter sp. V1I9]|nr:hypothetical protein [Arthrobacter sp. V1I9]
MSKSSSLSEEQRAGENRVALMRDLELSSYRLIIWAGQYGATARTAFVRNRKAGQEKIQRLQRSRNRSRSGCGVRTTDARGVGLPGKVKALRDGEQC